jgi:hypothetical protein
MLRDYREHGSIDAADALATRLLESIQIHGIGIHYARLVKKILDRIDECGESQGLEECESEFGEWCEFLAKYCFLEDDPRFGVCPECGDDWHHCNVGKSHFGYCDHCSTFAPIGVNLFSSWQKETNEQWERNRQRLDGMREVRSAGSKREVRARLRKIAADATAKRRELWEILSKLHEPEWPDLVDEYANAELEEAAAMERLAEVE